MPDEDLAYFEQRAEAELELAQVARNANAVKAHYYLAAFYLDRVHGGGAVDEPSPRDDR